MKSTKFYKILSIVLLILNIGTLTYFYVTKPPRPPKPGEVHLAEDIGLSGDAKKTVDAMEAKHHKAKRRLMKRDVTLHEKLYESLSDSAKSSAIILQINENRSEIERMTYDFFSEVSEHCNDEQRKKLNEMISKSLRMITGHPPKPPK